MVGLSVILENCRDISAKRSTAAQVFRKGSMVKPPSNPSSPTTPSSPSGLSWRKNPLSDLSSSSSSGFLDRCFLCKQKLLPGKDIFMYKGDRAFCSVECRCRQIFMDEEESAKTGCTREYNCSLAATSSPPSSRSGKRATNAFAY